MLCGGDGLWGRSLELASEGERPQRGRREKGPAKIEGLGAPDEFLTLGDVHRDGDHLIVNARFWNDSGNVESVIRAPFIDSTDDSVSFAEDHRCGDVAWHATVSAGNLYWGSHYDNAEANHVEEFGVTGTDPYTVRINRSERSFDQDYYVDALEDFPYFPEALPWGY